MHAETQVSTHLQIPPAKKNKTDTRTQKAKNQLFKITTTPTSIVDTIYAAFGIICGQSQELQTQSTIPRDPQTKDSKVKEEDTRRNTKEVQVNFQ